MAKKPGKKKINWGKVMGVTLFLILGAGLGFLLAWYQDTRGLGRWLSGAGFLTLLAVATGSLAALFAQIILHEAGHLVFGLISGYRFSSFRIGSLMWMKEEGRLRLRRLSLAGTGGQCLMEPPPMVDGRFPYRLYNLGGAIMNMLAGLVFLGLHFALRPIPALSAILLVAAFIGFFFALINGIPLQLDLVDNDGKNLLSVGKNPQALRAFWLQLAINARLARGERLKDMPDDWFTPPEEAAMNNSIVASLGVLAASRLMDEHAFPQADQLMARLLVIPSAIAGMHRGLMVNDRIYLELIGENRADVVKGMLSPSQRKFMKAMKGFISVLRTQYAHALLLDKDEERAAQWLAQFDKAAASYPYPSDVAAERELIALAKRKAQEEEGETLSAPTPL